MIRLSFLSFLVLTSAAFGRDETVFRLESFLSELGFPAGMIDGVADDDTHAAIRAYQTARGLPVTGGMSQPEFQALEAEIVALRAGVAPAAPQPAPSEPVQTQTAQAGKVVYHQLSSCGGELGVAIYRYFPISPSQRTVLEISDICWYAAEGRLESSDPLTGLTLVSSQDGFEKHEALASGSEDWRRNSVWLTRPTAENGADGQDWATMFIQNMNTKTPSRQNGALTWDGHGFLPQIRFSPTNAIAPFNVSFELSFGNGERRSSACSAGVRGTPDYARLKGVIDLRQPKEIALEQAEASSGPAQGTLDLSFSDNGKISGTGHVYIENPRLAGHGPCEWLRAELTIDQIIGWTSGSKGTEFRALGVGFGRYTDVNGETFEMYGTLTLSGYPTSFGH